MAATFVQAKSDNFDFAPISLTFDSPTTAGNLLLASFTGLASSVSATGPAGWTEIHNAIGSGGSNAGHFGIWYKIADGSETTVAITQNNVRPTEAFIAEISGLASTGVFDKYSIINTLAGDNAQTADTAIVAPSLTPNSAVGTALTILGGPRREDINGNGSSAIAGFSQLLLSHNGSTNRPWLEIHKLDYATASEISASATADSGEPWGAHVALLLFNAASGGSGPSLSGPSGASAGQTSASGSVSTDTGNGTLYAIVSTSSTQPSVAQIQAGLDHAGSAADWSGSAAVNATGVQNVVATGLTAETQYYFHFQQVNSSAEDSLVVSSAAFSTDVATQDYYVIPIIGQSNAIGRADIRVGIDDDYSGIGGAMQWSGGAAIPATNPLDHVGEIAGDTGFWLGAANTFAANNTFDKPILFVPFAQGGTGFFNNNWNQGDTLYTNAVAAINAAMASSPGNILAAIFWHQGENDAVNSSTTYQADITAMYSAMITDISAMTADTPFIIGHINDNSASTAVINVAMDSFAAAQSSVEVVQTNDLTTIDSAHFDAASLYTMGERYYAAYVTLTSTSLSIDVGTGMPDGTYRTVLVDDSNNVVYSGNVNYTNGQASVTVSVAAGTNLEGFVIDNEVTHVNGAVINGISA